MSDSITALRSVITYLMYWLMGLIMIDWGYQLYNEPVMYMTPLVSLTAFALVMGGVVIVVVSGAYAFVNYFREVDL